MVGGKQIKTSKTKMAESTVDYTFLGRSGLQISNIALGTMTFGKDTESLVSPILTY